jgi:hypothetical protein
MCVGPGLDSGRVKRRREKSAGRGQGIPASRGMVDDGHELKRGVNLGDDGSRLSAKLGNAAPALDLRSGRTERTFGRARALRHGALLARSMLPLEAHRGPDDGVELEEEKQTQNQTHTVL